MAGDAVCHTVLTIWLTSDQEICDKGVTKREVAVGYFKISYDDYIPSLLPMLMGATRKKPSIQIPRSMNHWGSLS